MQTERQRQAAEFRAEGEGAARRIRATADREVTVIKADATGESERVRGDGDAERNRIYAEAYNQDPNFFAFYRSMQAYDTALKSGATRLLLSPNSQFFQYFNDATGTQGDGASGPGVQSIPPAEPKALPETTPQSADPRAELGPEGRSSTGAATSGERAPQAQ
jgi:membrane protease subunit HflC